MNNSIHSAMTRAIVRRTLRAALATGTLGVVLAYACVLMPLHDTWAIALTAVAAASCCGASVLLLCSAIFEELR